MQWYGPNCPSEPDLSKATTLALYRAEYQERALACGFNLVQKIADLKAGKATVVYSCKGRKARANGNNALAPLDRRAKSCGYALPEEELCPFK